MCIASDDVPCKLTNTYTQQLRQHITHGVKHVVADCVKQKSEGKRVSTGLHKVHLYTHKYTIHKGSYFQVTNEDSWVASPSLPEVVCVLVK